MEKLEKDQKKARDREANWSTAEKECLRECINVHLNIVESKGNDLSMINKKKKAWNEIREAMLSAGYNRDICKLKAQWVRMKVGARKAVAKVKRASIATGNSVSIPELSAEENLIESMIVHELEDDDILIDSNCSVAENNFIESSNGEINSEEHSPINLCLLSSNDEIHKNDVSPINIASKSAGVKISKNNKTDYSAIKRLRSLHKTPSKSNVILERQRQISKEVENSAEIYKLQKQQLTAQIEHQERMNKVEEAQANEFHSLKLLQIQRQIDHEEELHILKVDSLRKKSRNEL